MFLLIVLKFKILIPLHSYGEPGWGNPFLAEDQAALLNTLSGLCAATYLSIIRVTQMQVFLQHSEDTSIQTSIGGKCTTKCLCQILEKHPRWIQGAAMGISTQSYRKVKPSQLPWPLCTKKKIELK